MIMGSVIITKSMATIIDVCNKIPDLNIMKVIIMLRLNVIIIMIISKVEVNIDLGITINNLIQKHTDTKYTMTTIKVVNIQIRKKGRCH